MLLERMPEVEVITLASGGFLGVGVGGPAIAAAEPSVLNEIYGNHRLAPTQNAD